MMLRAPQDMSEILSLVKSAFPYQIASINPRQVQRALLALIKAFLYAFVPQLIRTIYFNDPAPATKLHSTSWMNGMRGIASFCVFNEHYMYNFTRTLLFGIGTRPGDWYIHQLPVLELFNDGVCGVLVFFSVSGYVCSYRALQAMTTGDSESLFKSLPASVFRRWFRLYLPAFCSTFCISMLAYLGAYEPTRHYFDPKVKVQTFPGPGDEPQPVRFSTLLLQLQNWGSAMIAICNFWTEWPRDPPIDFHLWTIMFEYRASMHLYIALVALATCKSWARTLCLCLLGYIYAFRFAHYELLCFFYGAVIAQLDVLRQQKQALDHKQLPSDSSVVPSLQSRFVSWGFLRSTSRTILFGFALYLMSFPIRGVKQPAPLYKYTIYPLVPARYGKATGPKFPKQVGVLLLMYLLTTTPMQARQQSRWHRFLTCQVTTYLGKIMFGLFLCHGMVLHVFGYALPHVVWNSLGGHETTTKYLFGLFIGWFVSLVVSLWLADVWTREVEGRCMQFTQLLEGVLFEKRTERYSIKT